MHFQFLVGKDLQDTCVTTDEVPPELTSYKVDCDKVRCVSFSKGVILSQTINREDYTLRSTVISVTSPVRLYPYAEKALITLHYMLKGNVGVELYHFGKALLKAGMYHLFYVPDGVHNTADFIPGTYVSYQVDLSPIFLKSVIQEFPILSELLYNAEYGIKGGHQFYPGIIDFRIKTLLYDLAHCDKPACAQSLIRTAKIYELLGLYIIDLTKANQTPKDAHLRKLLKIKAYVINKLDHPHTIASLAGKFQISATTLKQQFRLNFNQTVYEFLLQQRMEAAQDLLLHTDLPINVIGTQIGYMDLSSFTRAFSKYFNCAPSQLRKI